MKPFVSAFALLLFTAPVLAQQPAMAPADDQQQPYSDSQPDPGQSNRSQADMMRQSQADDEYNQQAPDSGQQPMAQSPGYEQQPPPAPQDQQPYPPSAQDQQPYPPQPPAHSQPYPPSQQPYPPSQQPYPQAQQPYPPDQQPYPPSPQAQGPYGAPPPDAQGNYPAPPVYYPQRRQVPRPAPRPVEAAGIRPRPDAASYPVYREEQQFSVGARLLSEKEIEQKFSTPLYKHYLVVEVGVFPANAQGIQLRPENFTLRADKNDQAFFPATPEDIATDLTPRRGNMRVYPRVGVGYENGPWGHGTTTGVGVGVANGPYGRRPMGARRIMEDELRYRSIPQGNITQPVAGYLYFPVEKHAKHYSLEVNGNGGMVSLALPVPKN